MPRFISELPPGKTPGGRGKGAYDLFRKECQKNPGRWTVYPGSIGVATGIRLGCNSARSAWFGFECAQRRVDGRDVLYVRYNPGGSVPEERP